ncbi:MAG TPA: peptidoglycan DD-metalloendopeptidase family protein [Acidimicrobiia bacterium]|nr:peptidoglycan DD-metalloendopeptidase family protein [Acidimicrobiia bacterium]
MNVLIAILLSICLGRPLNGAVIAPFAPVGQFGGHWGIDLEATPGTVVKAPAHGTVTFAGTVAGMRTVTIDVGTGTLVSVSYLEEVSVSSGMLVRLGEELGRSGRAHGRPALHLSVRQAGRYVDPMPYLGCRPMGELYLLPPPEASTYAGQSAQRLARRDI